MSDVKRRYPIGAELIGENQTHFRVWAPKAREIDVVVEDRGRTTTNAPPATVPSQVDISQAKPTQVPTPATVFA